ncbi:hypothetical protein WD019_05525 [Fictibacillus sp. Mic-4]|uniref:hypothetical protein n=1 Tax=Fictibacillus TaxID=1329200 RepID=UPI000412ED16|nr:hypothetical protein [Fictibacillus gelatini]
MKVFIGSLLVVGLIGFGVWLILFPSFKKIGGAAEKIKNFLGDDEDRGKENKGKRP